MRTQQPNSDILTPTPTCIGTRDPRLIYAASRNPAAQADGSQHEGAQRGEALNHLQKMICNLLSQMRQKVVLRQASDLNEPAWGKVLIYLPVETWLVAVCR